MTLSYKAQFERQMAQECQRAQALGVGRAATALSLIFETLADQYDSPRTVILPATLCTSPPTVARLAGLKLAFCDTHPRTGLMEVEHLSATLEQHPATVAVLIAHLYGQTADIEALISLAKQHNCLVIEDGAQAQGAMIQGRPVGSFGDLSVLSLGHTKILDVGGGGVVLGDDEAWMKALRERAASLPEKSPDTALWSAAYRAGYYALAPQFNDHPSLKALIGPLCAQYPGLYRYALTEAQAEACLRVLPHLGKTLATRRHWMGAYHEALHVDGFEVQACDDAFAPWRFNLFLAKDQRQASLETLRASQIDASAWYPNAARFFAESDHDKMDYPGADQLEHEILNLWVDDRMTSDRLNQTRECLLHAREACS